MRIVITVMLLSAAATAMRRALLLAAASAIAGTLVLGGCGPAMSRPQVSEQELLKLRTRGDEEFAATAARCSADCSSTPKPSMTENTADGRKEPPVIDILIISGGGDWGAFGEAFLKGRLKVPAKHGWPSREFDAVTGVSTGTLIAPFAFLGDEKSIDETVNLYRNLSGRGGACSITALAESLASRPSP